VGIDGIRTAFTAQDHGESRGRVDPERLIGREILQEVRQVRLDIAVVHEGGRGPDRQDIPWGRFPIVRLDAGRDEGRDRESVSRDPRRKELIGIEARDDHGAVDAARLAEDVVRASGPDEPEFHRDNRDQGPQSMPTHRVGPFIPRRLLRFPGKLSIPDMVESNREAWSELLTDMNRGSIE